MPALEDAGSESASTVLLGKYEVGRLLGYGAFAKVYHARDVRKEQSVAIKAINKQRILKSGLASNVKREISIMRRLRHPHIVRLLEVLANKKKIYFVLEFAKGGELFSKLTKSRFSEDLSRRYFQQLISAVGYCHLRSVYHRDLKPENLLLDENWDLKLTDFGLSALSDQIRPDGLLHTLCGTSAYVAPEILSKKGYDGAKVDIWSCGIILYVLNVGYLPFNDPNLMVMYRKICKGDYRVPKWMSQDLKRFLSRLLDTNPRTRITVDEIINDPWFKIGYTEVKIHHHHHHLDMMKYETAHYLNAFDIISFSSGYNLCCLFDDREVGERFLSALPPEEIIQRVLEVTQGERLTLVTRRDWGVRLVGGHNCNFVLTVEVRPLTEELVVVEIRRRESGEIWKHKIRPCLSSLIYSPDRQVAGNS